MTRIARGLSCEGGGQPTEETVRNALFGDDLSDAIKRALVVGCLAALLLHLEPTLDELDW